MATISGGSELLISENIRGQTLTDPHEIANLGGRELDNTPITHLAFSSSLTS